VWRTGLSWLEVPSSRASQRASYRLLGTSLEERRDFFLWPGHRREDARAVLERVVELIARNRVCAMGAERERLDKLHDALAAALVKLPGPCWDPTKQRYRPDPGAQAILIGLDRKSDTRSYVFAARDQLREEYNEVQQRGLQLSKELAEGTSLSLETKLRALVRSMRERGDLPAGRPPRNAERPPTTPGHIAARLIR
jgi:hypothetical protein